MQNTPSCSSNRVTAFFCTVWRFCHCQGWWKQTPKNKNKSNTSPYYLPYKKKIRLELCLRLKGYANAMFGKSETDVGYTNIWKCESVCWKGYKSDISWIKLVFSWEFSKGKNIAERTIFSSFYSWIRKDVKTICTLLF